MAAMRVSRSAASPLCARRRHRRLLQTIRGRPPPPAPHYLTSRRRQGLPLAGLPSCRPSRPRPSEWLVSSFTVSARMGWEGQKPLRLQHPTCPQRTSRMTPPDRPPPAPSDWPRLRRPSQHPPLVGEQETRTPELSSAKKKTFRVDYNPTGAPHTEIMA